MRDHPSPPPLRWRHGNHFRLLIDGTAFFPVMLQAIDAAQRQVLLEMYLVESGRLIDRFIGSLIAATARGVRVCLLLDHFGCLGLNSNDRTRLTQHGVELVYYNPLRFGSLRRNLFRDHRKLIVVDGACAFVG
ncbi:MAG: phospholipase D-like domain-containing protein, partial [Thiohalobacteraceae bacterium]